jgi:hypothetical protein
LVFRALTYLVQIPFGAITYLYWQHNRAWRVSKPGSGPESEEDESERLPI